MDRTVSETAPDALLGAQHKPLDSIVREEILRRIMTRELAPGARLIETSIAADLNVSRGPVRVAIRQLELEGFVVISPRRGASVATITVAEALECYEIRTAMEGLAARLAATRRTDADIARIRAILVEGEQMLSDHRWDQVTQLNNDFHVALAIASGNSELVLLMRQYSKRIAWMFSRSAQRRGAQAWREHERIVDAIVNQDVALASGLAKEHIEASRAQFVLSTPIAADPTAPSPSAPRRNEP